MITKFMALIKCQFAQLMVLLNTMSSTLTNIGESLGADPVVVDPTKPTPNQGNLVIMDSLCVSIDGGDPEEGVPALIWNPQTSVVDKKVWMTLEGDIITGAVVVLDKCDCVLALGDCGIVDPVDPVDPNIQADILMLGFTHGIGLGVVGEVKRLTVDDGVNPVTTVDHDGTTTAAGGVKSSLYGPFLDLINALPNWSIALDTDMIFSVPISPLWKVSYDGVAPATLTLTLENTVKNTLSFWTITVAGDGTISGIGQMANPNGGSSLPAFN